ncbi:MULTISPECIES: CcoQ/FixQ family Cbb3-type cytochrome c oxidase assembly chaperone [unclassified Rhizobium]|uniref:CcoQ/FixQ family Cbb3-type cytochrome c oxidase assembly chaperone n=1 Tax=unclassified Rhizobium TaxID=2613769 RepID=UPI0007154149|nr:MULTISPECIES: CcoQ/FixQ family Cbb3-type cytochrome c oxidase assembly chaperone [unclassified Rhizobium]KQS83139.1 nitrogen fixation protein FixQ [Rhizobium sp. Leaf386]KQS88974.1 nitrogen fixation protein FixQ [Rhizobium sp. Leaf391]KQT92822.1 nitrogen fixation protein FixQ [Rhizobium sp. Leaf453]
MDYHTMRTFADSWGLVSMLVFFLAASAFVFRPGSRDVSAEAARIPLKDDSDER